MKKYLLIASLFLFNYASFGQAGHIMHGVGAVNMSMGGAATAQPLDMNGAMQWNPAGLSRFSGREVSLSVGAFFSSPELSSSFGPISGITMDDRGTSLMPALAFVYGNEDSKHTFGFSAFGISGFGVTFPENTNYPQDALGNPNPNYNPNLESNPINFPQNAGGFGRIESDYILLQIGLTYAYEITPEFSIGIQPNLDYATLELAPNPIASPDFPPPMGTGKGYPIADKATAIGYGGQIGIFYDSGDMIKLGASYKSKQYFSEFDFDQTYIDGTTAPNVKFKMNYPAIYSVGLGLSGKKLDFALDARYVDYENTEGFEESGWAIADSGPAQGFPTGAVSGFGWESMVILSTGLQYKILDNLPVRIGYTHSTNPIKDELAFFSTPATAVIENAMQFGLGYRFGEKFKVDAMYHYGFKGEGSKGQLLSPAAITASNPLGAIPNSSVSYKMDTSMIQLTLNYDFGK